jgi:hypothetical protein
VPLVYDKYLIILTAYLYLESANALGGFLLFFSFGQIQEQEKVDVAPKPLAKP